MLGRFERALRTPIEEGAVDLPHEAVLLRIFTSVADRFGLDPLHLAIVKKAREVHLAGATVLRGSLGFGHSALLHKAHLFPLAQDLPVVIEIVDDEDKINAFLPVLDEMMESGLVTLEKARVLQYGRQRTGLLQRIKEHFTGHAHTPNAARMSASSDVPDRTLAGEGWRRRGPAREAQRHRGDNVGEWQPPFPAAQKQQGLPAEGGKRW
jgi:PII-like signaling protein